MKNFFLFLLLLASVHYSVAQKVGIGTKTPNASAVLELKSSSQGFLPPRMSFAEIIAIPSPAPGLMIYNTTFNKPVYFDTTRWRFFDNTLMQPKIGDHILGGIVFYIDPTGNHGLIAANTDQSTSISWWNGSYVLTGAFSSSEGAINTTAIINFQGNTGSYAAKICRDYRGGGYSDWFLPAKDQLNLLYAQKGVTGLASSVYWSSTEIDISNAWDQDIYSGGQLQTVKNYSDYVRAVRAF